MHVMLRLSTVLIGKAIDSAIAKPANGQAESLLCLFLLQTLEHLPALSHHVSVQHICAWHVNSENRVKRPFQLLAKLSARRSSSRVYQPALARDTHGVQHEESVVAEPGQPARNRAEVQAVREVAVADNLSSAPGEQHGRESRRGGAGLGEIVGNAPDKEEARCNLHQGREKRSAHDT